MGRSATPRVTPACRGRSIRKLGSMEKRTLGGCNLSVSVFGLGIMTFGAETDEPTAHRMLDGYLEAGGRFIDTADVYSRGVSEEIIGRWLGKGGGTEGVVIATKAGLGMLLWSQTAAKVAESPIEATAAV